MLRNVTLRYNGFEKTYPVEADTHYNARVEALGQFLEEFKIPGRPVEYVTTKKGVIGIEVKSAVDRRTLVRDEPPRVFYLEKVEGLRRSIRESSFPESIKVKATKLLLTLGKLLGESVNA